MVAQRAFLPGEPTSCKSEERQQAATANHDLETDVDHPHVRPVALWLLIESFDHRIGTMECEKT